MKHFNFNQSLRNLVNNGKGLFILSLALTTFGVGNAWGISKSKLTVNIVGGGQVAITRNNTAPSSYSSSSVSDNQSHGTFDIKVKDTYYVWLKPNTGFSGTCSINSTSDASITENGTNSYKVIITGSTGTTERTVTATFKATFYGKALAYADPVAGGGTWISLNGNWPTSDANYIAEDNSTKNENTTAAPTFNAQYDAKAKDGYEFVGWYTANNGGGTKKSSTVRYTEAFTASSVDQNVPTTIIRYAYFKALQYYYFKAQAGKVGAGNVYASFSDGSYSATSDIKTERATTLAQSQSTGTYAAYFKAEETDAAYHFAGWYTDAACTEANRVSTNLTYSEQISGSTATTEASAKTITRYAKFVQELTPEVTANYSGSPKAMFVDDEIASAFSFLNTSEIGSGLSFVSSNNNIITYDATNNKVIAKNEGTATLTFTQTKQDIIKAGEFSFTFNVSKIDNTLSVADVSPKMYVGDNVVDEISTNSDATINASSTDETIAYYDVANNKIVAQNTNNQSFNSKEVAITISQEATYKYTAVSKTIKVTVSKWDNHISINGNQDSYAANAFMDGYAQIDLTATNTDYVGSPISNNQTAGNNIATFYPNEKVVYSTYNLGDATWTVSQPENYKYKAANATFTIHVVKQAEATDCYVKDLGSQTLEGKLGRETEKFTWSDSNAAGTLSYQVVGQKVLGVGSVGNSVQAYQLVNGSWIKAGSSYDDYSNDNYTSNEVTLDPTATGFYFTVAGSYASTLKDIHVTRKTFLNASNFTINTQDDNTTLIYPGKTGTGSFHVDYSLANGGDLKIVCDNPKFIIDKTIQTNVNCTTGSLDVNMTYTSQTAGTDYAHVVIYNNVYRKEITVTGITQKHQQTLKWKDNFDQMSLGQEVNDAASSSHGVVTYTSDKPGVIRVDNGTTLVAVAKGDAKITATAAGDNEYAEISIEKTISVTEKCVQYIVWTQSLMGLKLGDPNRTLNAYATSEIEECTSNNGGRLVTYTSADESVVKVVNTNELQIVGVGTTTVTAHQAGGLDSDGHEYEPATKENTVVVKDPSAKCETFVYEQSGDAEQFFQMNTDEIKGTEHSLIGEPAKITFRAKREYWNLAVNYSKGNIVLDAYTPTGGWTQVLDCGEPPIGSYKEYSTVLSREVTKIRFRRPKGGQGYHYIADANVEMLRYIETSTPSTFQANVGEEQQQKIYLNYSNITSDILLSMASGAKSHFSVDKTQIIGNCGDVAKNVALTIFYAPTTNTEALGEETETLIISDGTTTTNVALKGVANRVARSIIWNIDDQNAVYTIQTINLNATAETNLHQVAGDVAITIVNHSSTEGCGTINNNVLSFAKAGNVSVVATTIEDVRFLPATPVYKYWTVNLTPTEVITNPEIDGEIVYGAKLTDLKLKANTGAARNTINQQAVEGTFAITSGDISTAGQHTVTVTFTPANTDMYASCTKDITIIVQKAQPDALAHAGNIVYGAEVQTSILTNEGTEGTWSWTDEKKGQVLNVGTYEGLQVHFTPTDKTNYNEMDGTVSLTVTKAQPTITWTGETTFEWGEINNYFVASNSGEVVMSSLDESIATIQDNKIIPVKAGTVSIQGDMAESANYQSATLTQTITINVPSENKFTNAADDNDWNNPTNWSAGLVPEKMDEANIVVSGELNIEEKVVVGSLTIEDGGSVNVLQGGDLTIQSASGEADAFGDLYVKNGGDVTLNGTLNVHDFVIESSIGTADGSSKSGQITNADKLNFNEGDAYIDIHLDPSGTADDSQWYGFTVPFEVDIATGVYRQENDGSFKQLKDKTNFDIMQYNPAKRLTTGKGWEYYHGILHPGEFYYLAIDGNNNVYRFRKKADAEFTTEAQVELHTNGDISNPNANWNPVGNPCLRYTTTDYDGFVQVYKNGQSAYLTVDASDVTYVVGCPFFVQAQEEGSLVLETSDATEGQFYAPRRMAVDKTKNQIQLLNQGKVEDQIFIMASEDATSDYKAGSDLLKAGVSKLCGQMWINAYGQQLSVQDAPLQDETALYNLSLYAPKAGEYMLHVGSQTNSGEIYLTLNGTIIWNLSQSDYPISLFKGTTNEYGLVFRRTQPNTPTDLVSPTKTKGVDKFIHHEQMYILHNGQLYNATGAMVK